MSNCALSERRETLSPRRLLAAAALALAFGSGGALHADEVEDLAKPLTPAIGGVIDLSMYHDPVIETPDHPRLFHPRLQSLWLEALAREEPYTRLEAAWTFREAARQGMADMDEAAARLTEVVREDANDRVAEAAAEALLAIDHADAADAVLERGRATRGDDFVRVADAALARWDHEPAQAWWLERLDDEQASRRSRASAVQALGQVRAVQAEPVLRELALDQRAAVDVRLAAADALARIAGEGLAADAEALATDGGATVLDRLVAVRMLTGHAGDAALSLMEQLTDDDDPTVASRAMTNLHRHDAERAAGVAPPLLAHADANVRLAALRAAASQQTPEAVQIVGGQLDDAAPMVRTFARRTLTAYDEDTSLQSMVREQVEAALADDAAWRALEQAGVLAAELDHNPTAERLAELLTHDRPEVRRAAANAMRVLAVPETLPAIAARAEQLTETEGADSEERRQISEETTQLFLAIGEMRHEPADDLLRRYVPKGSGFSSVSRSAAIWALGRIHEGESRPDLAEALIGRATDQSLMDPESEDVQRFSAITLGRLDAADHVDPLRGIYRSDERSDTLREASRWAIEQLTGEDVAPLEERPGYITGWFIEPVD